MLQYFYLASAVPAGLRLFDEAFRNPACRVQLSRSAALPLAATVPLDQAPLPEEDNSSLEQSVDPHVAQEQALSAGRNLLKPDVPKE